MMNKIRNFQVTARLADISGMIEAGAEFTWCVEQMGGTK